MKLQNGRKEKGVIYHTKILAEEGGTVSQRAGKKHNLIWETFPMLQI